MLAGAEKQSLFPQAFSVGPQILVTSPTGMTVLPLTIAGPGSYVSGVIAANGFKTIAVGATLSQTGTITIQRYLDAAGLIPVGAAITAALVAATPNWAVSTDSTPFLSFQVTIANTSGSLGNLTNTAIVLGSA